MSRENVLSGVKACSFCKRRKIKCDQNEPCSNCIKYSSSSCVRPERKPRVTSGPKVAKSKDDRDLQDKVSKLESMLNSLLEKDKGKGKELPKNLQITDEKQRNSVSYQNFDHLFGTHSAFHIFSKFCFQRMSMMVDLARDPELLVILGKTSKSFKSYFDSFTEAYIATGSLFPVKDALQDLSISQALSLASSITDLYFGSFIIESNELNSLITLFYENERALSDSEFLLIGTSLSICLSITPLVGIATLNLTLLRKTFLEGSLSIYKRKISLVSEGISSVQAILMLIFCLQSELLMAPTYNLLSTAVRYAQELGLHRFETYSSLSEEESILGRRIWLTCELFDVEISTRLGKPNLIHTRDVSTFSETDVFAHQLEGCNINIHDSPNSQCIQFVQSSIGLSSFTFQYLAPLNKLRMNSYDRLFAAGASFGDFESLSKTMILLNNITAELIEHFEISFKPIYYDEDNFNPLALWHSATQTSDGEDKLTLHMSIFHHIMIINRLPFQMFCLDQYDDFLKNPISVEFTLLSLRSSRSILYIAKMARNFKVTGECINWISFYVFSAYVQIVSILIRNSNRKSYDSGQLSDFVLLAETLRDYFAHFNDILGKNIYLGLYMESSVFDFPSRVMLRFLLNVTNATLEKELYLRVPEVRELLESCDEIETRKVLTEVDSIISNDLNFDSYFASHTDSINTFFNEYN